MNPRGASGSEAPTLADMVATIPMARPRRSRQRSIRHKRTTPRFPQVWNFLGWGNRVPSIYSVRPYDWPAVAWLTGGMRFQLGISVHGAGAFNNR